MLTQQQKDEHQSKFCSNRDFTESVRCKSHNIESINLGLDWVEYAGRVIFHNDHDVEIGSKEFSGVIKRAAEKRGLKVLIVSKSGNSWIHEDTLFVFNENWWSVR